MKKELYNLSTEEWVGIMIIIVGVTIYTNTTNIRHWYDIAFNLSSYNPHVPIIGLASTWGGLLVTINRIDKGRAPAIFLFFMAVIYFIFQVYGIFKTYPEMHDVLRKELTAVIAGMVIVTWSVIKD